MKSGGGNYQAPDTPQPQGGTVPYGKASPFNPQYTSFLPGNGQTAMLGDPSRLEGGPVTPLQTQQEELIAAQEAAAAQAALNPIKNELTPREKFIQMIVAEERQRKSPGGFGGGSGGGFSHGDRGASYGGRSGSGGLY